MNEELELLNADGLDDSITKDYFSVDGGDGDEDNTEYEGEESEVGGVPPQDLPKFRQLVRDKKLQLKAQWGKGHFKNESYMQRSCTKVFGKEVCINTPKIRVVWVAGWRKRWREFKQSGGLAQLKLQSQTPMEIGTPNVAPVSEISAIVKPPRMLKFLDATPVAVAALPVKGAPVTEQKKEESTNTDWQKEESNPSSPRTANKSVQSESMQEEKKFLGMPKNIGIAVAVVGVAATAIGLVIWKMKKK